MKARHIWRIAGASCLVLCGLMAWRGLSLVRIYPSFLFQFAYWGAFLVLLIIAFVMALLDVRYTRVLYALEQRRIFHETIGHPEFRQALRTAQRNKKTPADADMRADDPPDAPS